MTADSNKIFGSWGGVAHFTDEKIKEDATERVISIFLANASQIFCCKYS